MEFINYAHRGFSELYPENTMCSFYMGIETGAKGIETDVQRTSDGVLVLFHDDTMERVLGIDGRICDFTYAQLLEKDFGIFKGARFKGERIVTLDEFLTRFAAKDLTFAIEIKQVGIEAQLLEAIDRHGVRDKSIITSFKWESILEVRRLDPTVRIGWLVEKVDDAVIGRLVANRMQQVCPRIDGFNAELLAKCRQAGLSVRYWGVSDNERMGKALRLGGDGTTINNPAMLQKALEIGRQTILDRIKEAENPDNMSGPYSTAEEVMKSINV